MYCFKKVCFVWITIMVFAVEENVTSHIGALFVSSSDTMLVSIGRSHCLLQHCAKLSISLVAGVIPNWWCTRICGYNKKKGLAKRCQSTKTLSDETAIFMATHLQNIITWLGVELVPNGRTLVGTIFGIKRLTPEPQYGAKGSYFCSDQCPQRSPSGYWFQA